MLAEAADRLDALENGASPSWDGLMQPLYELSEPLDYAWHLVLHFMGVMNSDAWRAAQESLQPEVVAFSLRVGQSEALFRGMRALRDSPAWDELTEPRRRIVVSAIRGAELSGVGLAAEQRTRFNEIQRELAACSTRFGNNLLDAVKAFELVLRGRDDVEGLPDSMLRAAAQSARAHGHATADAQGGPWRISLEQALFVPFMKHSRRRDLREALYRAYVTRASAGACDNGPVLVRILELRREKARLLGQTSHAEVSLRSKMAPDVAAVEKMLDELVAAARPHAEADQAELEAFARGQGGPAGGLARWDVPFWAERRREHLFAFTEEDLRPFFQFPRVLNGLFELGQKLFGIDIRAADGEVPVWHPDVRFFRVSERDGTPLASFYLDPYSRPDTKRGGAWMAGALSRQRRPDGGLVLPAAYLVCNQTLPDGERPSLMTFNEVTTLFHEFGHALQHLLTRVDEADAAGIGNVEWDAVELPSQFMENWCYHRATLRAVSAHVDTGETLPDELYEKILRSRTYRAGSGTLRQVFFAQLDMALHHRYRAGGPEEIARVKARIAEQATVTPLLPEDRLLCGFSHIFAGAYAAGYYSYKWAEVLAADAFEAFEEAGIDDPGAVARVGRRFRDTVLSLGGGKHPMEVFRLFRGREPGPEALLRRNGLDRPPEVRP